MLLLFVFLPLLRLVCLILLQHWHSTWYVCARPFVCAYLYHKYIRHLNVFIILSLSTVRLFGVAMASLRGLRNKCDCLPETERIHTRRRRRRLEERKKFSYCLWHEYFYYILSSRYSRQWDSDDKRLRRHGKHSDEPHWSHYLTTLRLTKDDANNPPLHRAKGEKKGISVREERKEIDDGWHKSLIDT